MKSSSEPFRCRIRSKKICEVTGADNKNFLQRLLTNDLEQLADKEMQLSSWCNIKGRVSILIKVVKLEDNFMLLVDDFNLERLMQEFSKFIFNSQVTITNISDNFSIYVNFNKRVKNTSNLLIRENHLTWEIEPNKAESCNPTDNKTDYDDRLYRLYCINNLIPSLSENLCDKFLPQEINLEQLGGLSFKKGCFPGQEVIARVKYKGKLKKQLKQFISLQPYNGDQSFTHLTNSTGERLGVVVNTVKADDNHLHILAVSGEGATEDLFLDNIIPVNPYG